MFCAGLSLSKISAVVGLALVVLKFAGCPSASLNYTWDQTRRLLGWQVGFVRVCKAHSLWVSLKHKSRNFKHVKKKDKWFKWSVMAIKQVPYSKGVPVQKDNLAL